MKKKILSTTFSFVISLFLAIVLLAGALCIFANNTVCTPGYLTQIAKTSGFTDELYEEIRYNWENLISITGVEDPASIMPMLTKEQVSKDVLATLENAYTGTSSLNTDELKSQLEAKVREYAYSNNIHATPEAELNQNIEDLVNACMEDYRRAVSIPLLPTILGAVGKVSPLVMPAAGAVAVASLILLVFLFFLQLKRRNTLYFAAISAATNAVILIGLPALASAYQIVKRLPFEASALKTLVTAYAQSLLDQMQVIGFLFLGAAALLIAVYALLGFLLKKNSAKV